MSLPAFTTTSKLTDSTTTTTQQVVRVVNTLIGNLQQIFTALLQKVQLDSLIIQNVVLKPGVNTIQHTLGRNLSGWEIVRQRSQASIWDSQDSCPNPSVNLQLNCDYGVTVDILVF